MTLYRTIVADPPWPYPEGFAHRGNNPRQAARDAGAKSNRFERTYLPYASMTLEQIGCLPVADLAAKDARLFLWSTSRYLPQAFSLLPAWGFSYKQMLVWDKTPYFAPLSGSVASIAAEFLLVAVCGSPTRIATWPTSVVRARKNVTEHSRKPDVFLDIAEAVSPGPYLELFARRQRLGWDTWGDQALEHVEMHAG